MSYGSWKAKGQLSIEKTFFGFEKRDGWYMHRTITPAWEREEEETSFF